MPTWFEGFCVCCLYAAVFCGAVALAERIHPRFMRLLYMVLTRGEGREK